MAPMFTISDWLFKKTNWLAGCLAIAALFGFILFCANVEIKDLDLWLHLATGRHIVRNFSIPLHDFLSCTIAGKPWIDHEWLFQVIVHSVYRLAGAEGLIALRAWTVLLTFVVLLLVGYIRERSFWPTLILLLVFLVYQIRLTLRPDIFSLLFFALYMAVLGSYSEKRWSSWLLVAVQIVWVNMHGYFILGPLVTGIVWAGEWLRRHSRLPFEWGTAGCLSDGEYRRLKWTLLAVVLACLVNPYFIRGAWYPLGVFFSLGGESRIFFSQIQELEKPIHWSSLLSWYPYPHYRILIVLSLASFVVNRRKIDAGAFLIWVVFLLLSLGAVRNVVFFAFAAYFAFLANYQHFSLRKFLPVPRRTVRMQAVCTAVLNVIIILWIAHYADRLLLRGYYDFDKFERKSEFGGISLRNFPYRAADFLVDNHVRGNFFNDFNSGAYLLGRASPAVKVFIDGRTEMYGTEFYKDYQKIWEGHTASFEEAAGRYRLTGAFLGYVYVPAPAKIIRYLYDSAEWALVYFNHDAAIFLRDLPENREWIERYRVNLDKWQPPDAELLRIGTQDVTAYRQINRAYALFNMGFPGKAMEEIAEALRIDPYDVKAYKLMGKIYNDRQEYAKGFESLRKAKLIDPDDMNVRFEIAKALYYLGEIGKAKEQCLRALSRRSKNPEAMLLLSLICISEEKYDEAMEALKKAQEKGALNAKGFTEAGDLFAGREEFNRAREAYAMAAEVEPQNKKIQERLSGGMLGGDGL